MTLTVSAYIIEPNGDEKEIRLVSDLAGVESARKEFYGSALSISLGLKRLPQLREYAMLTFRGAELRDLLLEVETLIRAQPPGNGGDYYRFRLNNIKAAAELAMEHGEAGVVYIG